MEFLTRIVVVVFIGIAIMQIFGNKGIFITISIMASILAAVYYFQNNLLYMPDIPNAAHSPKGNPQGYRHPSEQGLNSEQVRIITSDDINIKGWLIKNQKNSRLIVYFHENAGNLGFRIPFIKMLHSRTNSDVLLVAYRGFSDSEGKPTEQGLQKDALAVMEYAVNYKYKAELQGLQKDIYVLGRSLGGAVTIYLAELGTFKNQIKGLILQNTFTSIQDMVKVIFPVLSLIQFLHRNFWPSKARIGAIEAPILFIRSLKDEIVPTTQMLELIKEAENCRLKEEFQIENGTHNVAWETNPKAYFDKLNQFFGKIEKE